MRVTIDHFGTGRSSLGRLTRLPVDRLKIDRSFVRDVHRRPDQAAAARAIIALGRSLGLGIIAEGVEKQQQASFLSTHGCHRMQGYLFGGPTPPDRFAELCEAAPSAATPA